MVSRSDYTDKEVNACKAVLIEIVNLLGEIRDEMVIIGGWIPSFLFSVMMFLEMLLLLVY